MVKINAVIASSIYLCIIIVKRITAILLLLIYTAAVAGVHVSGFYCCGKLRSTTVSAMAFAKSTAKNDDGCCKHKQAVLKVNDTHESAGLARLSTAKSILFHIFYRHPANIIATNNLACAISNPVNGPPLRPQTPLYIQYCNYRI